MKNHLIFLLILFFYIQVSGQTLNLLAPHDGATNVQRHPIFTWQLSGLTTQSNIKYTFKIAEYNNTIGGQNSINTNLLYASLINNNNPFQIYYYPTNAPSLNDCSEYVWQVIASYTTYTTQEPIVPLNTYNYPSQVFLFKTNCSNEESLTVPTSTSKFYIELKKQTDNFVHLVPTDSLYIKYKEPYYNNRINYKIYTADGIIINDTLSVSYGLNYLSINIDKTEIETSSAEEPKIHVFELKTPKGDILRTKFEKK